MTDRASTPTFTTTGIFMSSEGAYAPAPTVGAGTRVPAPRDCAGKARARTRPSRRSRSIVARRSTYVRSAPPAITGAGAWTSASRVSPRLPSQKMKRTRAKKTAVTTLIMFAAYPRAGVHASGEVSRTTP